MSDKVDTRVVQMEFDNRQFEKNVKKTNQSLQDLKQNLNFKGVGDSLDEVKVKISALEITVTTFIANIANKFTNLAITMIKSLSVDNIASGWEKFGEKTTSVATMMAQKIRIAGEEITDLGLKTEVVNKQLELLNWFSDETSYSFNDMVNSVGKFTAAGQDLDVSVKAMEGIATWAALSGQNAQTASRAMYQLAQAMGKGKIQKIDWMSIQNANMDTEEFRETILNTAVAMGQLIKEGNQFVTKTGKKFTQAQFADMLSEGWFTSDVLVKGLNKYSAAVEQIYEISEREGLTASEVLEKYGDTLDEFGVKAFKAAQEARTFLDVILSVKDAVSSKWMTTFESIFGSESEAVKLWTDLANELYDVFAESGNFRNDILSVWKELGGRDDLFARGGDNQGAFWNIYDAIIAVRDLIKSAWDKVFPISEMEDYSSRVEDVGNKFKSITKRIREFTERLKMNEATSLRLSKIFQGLFNILKVGINIMKAIRFILDPIIEFGKELVNVVLDQIIYYGEKFNKVGSKFESIVVKIRDIIANVLGLINPSVITDIISKITQFLKSIYAFLTPFNEISSGGIIEYISGFLNNLLYIVRNFIKTIGNISGNAPGGLVQAFGTLFKGLITFIKSLIPVLQILLKSLGKLLEIVGVIISKIANTVLNILTGKGTTKLLKIVVVLGIIFTAFVMIYNLVYLIAGIINPISVFVDSLTGVLDSISAKLKSGIIKSIASSILKIAISLALISSINEEALTNALAAIIILVGVCFGIIKALEGLSKNISDIKNLKAITNVMKSLTLILLGLSVALRIIANKDWKSILVSTAAISALIYSLIGVVLLIQKFIKMDAIWTFMVFSESMIPFSIALITFGIAMEIMSGVIATLSVLDYGKIWNGVATIVVFTGLIIVTSKLINLMSSISLFIFSASLIAFGVAMSIMSTTILILGQMNPDELKQGRKAVQGFLAIVALSIKLIGVLSALKFGVFSASLALFGNAMIIMSGVISILGSMDAGSLRKAIGAIIALTGGIVALSSIAQATHSTLSLISLSIGMTAFASAMIPFTTSLLLLGDTDIKQLGIGLLTMAASMLVLISAAALAKPLITTIISLSAAMLLAGVGMLAMGIGLSALAVGISAIIETIAMHFDVMKESLITLATLVTEVLFAAIKSVVERLTELIPSIFEMVSVLIDNIIELLFVKGPAIIETIIAIIDNLLRSLADHAESIFTSVFEIIQTLLTKLVENIGPIAEKLILILLGIIDKVTEYIPQLVEKIIKFLIAVVKSLFENIGPLIDVLIDNLFDFIAKVIVALTRKVLAIASLITKVVLIIIAAVIRLTIASLGALSKLFITFVSSILMLLLYTFLGLSDVILSILKTVVQETLSLLIDVITLSIPALGKIGKVILQAILAGLLELLVGSFKWVLEAVDWIFGTDFADKVGNAVSGLAESIANDAKNTVKKLGGGIDEVQDELKKASNNISKIINMTADSANEAISEGVSQIDDTLSDSISLLGGSLQQFGEDAGNNLMQGLSDGASEEDANKIGESIGASIEKGFSDITETHSPSRVFIRFGRYLMMGLSKGITDSEKETTDAMSDIISKSLSIANDILNDDAGEDLVIKVGMDISNVESQTAKIQDIMSGVNRPGITAAGINADYTSRSMSRKLSNVKNTDGIITNNNSNDVTYNNVFNITSSDPEGAADEIDKILQKQAIRKKLAHGN